MHLLFVPALWLPERGRACGACNVLRVFTYESAFDELLNEIGIQKCVEVYRSHMFDIKLYPGVIEMIEELKSRDIRIGIITDGRPEGQRNKMAALGLDIGNVIITDELGGIQFRKLYDIGFRIMVTRWRISLEKIVYVGDNLAKDFKASQQLGMKSVYFENADGMYLKCLM